MLIKRLGNGKLPGKTVQFPFQFWYRNLSVAVTVNTSSWVHLWSILLKTLELLVPYQSVLSAQVCVEVLLPTSLCLNTSPPKLDFDLIDHNGSRGTIEPLQSIISMITEGSLNLLVIWKLCTRLKGGQMSRPPIVHKVVTGKLALEAKARNY